MVRGAARRGAPGSERGDACRLRAWSAHASPDVRRRDALRRRRARLYATDSRRLHGAALVVVLVVLLVVLLVLVLVLLVLLVVVPVRGAVRGARASSRASLAVSVSWCVGGGMI